MKSKEIDILKAAVCLLIIFVSLQVSAQTKTVVSGKEVIGTQVNPFVRQIAGDSEKVYFQIELRQFGSWFERGYFITKLFEKQIVTVLETKASADFLTVFSSPDADVSQIIRGIKLLKEETQLSARELPAETKEKMLVSFEKYK
jgi:hypothetical protein